jgi:predicted transcriptional regulator
VVRKSGDQPDTGYLLNKPVHFLVSEGKKIFGMMVTDDNDRLVGILSMAEGVISKTDLIIAYLHGVSPQTRAREIMSRPVHCISKETLLSAAIQQMLVRDVQRLFVQESVSHPGPIIGVLALSDAARFRSGSCRACSAGRLLMKA